MSMNTTPSGERIHIGFFGRRNAGKSSLVNAVTGQNLAVVSDTKGTTTDPVRKAMELLPVGPVLIIDTPGYDDEGSLGRLRVERAQDILGESDFAVLVADPLEGIGEDDIKMALRLDESEIPWILAVNKSDAIGEEERSFETIKERIPSLTEDRLIFVSAKTGENVWSLKEKIGAMAVKKAAEKRLVGDLIKPMDLVILVIPIDKAAPKGRLILPQQQTIRDILDAGAIPVCVRNTELSDLMKRMPEPPAFVITDSQVFEEVAAIVPDHIRLTSFSILMARYKGFLSDAIEGAHRIDSLKDGDRVLIAEGCTHHRQCDDIGTVKLPRWLRSHTGKDIQIATSSGREFPKDLSDYRLVIHCGGCMLNEKEVDTRRKRARAQGIPFTNYGTAIAHMKGILDRSITWR